MRVLALPGGRRLDLSGPPLVMGILNTTPDSFYAGSRLSGVDRAVAAGMSMVEDGADLLDIGGESSRPGSEYVAEDVELERVVPVVERLRRSSDIPISVDTRKSAVAREALRAGADIINDISSLRDDAEMASVAIDYEAPVILMHMRGTPRTMQKNPHYDDPVKEVCRELLSFAKGAQKMGIKSVILDPGIGFGKRLSDNLAILAGLPKLRALGFPVLIGLSRKSSIGMILRSADGALRPAEGRLAGTLAANAVAAVRGADILRVHDVAETADLVKVIYAIRQFDDVREDSWTG